MPSTLELLSAHIAGRTGAADEGAVLSLLRGASDTQLDEAIEKADTAALFDTVDNRLLGADHRSELIRLLAYERRGALGFHALASLIQGMQHGRTDHEMEVAIRDILLASTGNDLSHLKNTINLATGRHDLEGLIFDDIDDDTVREQILAHFAAQAAHAGIREAKVLSDIDDTAIARIHEERYPKGIIVPGILAFYEALDLGPDDTPRSRGDLTFVTARPSDAFGLMKGHSRRTLTAAGVRDLSIMTGSWFNVATHDAMAAKKLENIAHYAMLYPEYDLVFIGDSGQGDIAVGEKMRETHGDVVRGVFIHDVVATSQAERDALEARGVFVVDTYVGAARRAHELGLVSEHGLGQVIEETRRELAGIAWESDEQKAATLALVDRDIAGA